MVAAKQYELWVVARVALGRRSVLVATFAFAVVSVFGALSSRARSVSASESSVDAGSTRSQGGNNAGTNAGNDNAGQDGGNGEGKDGPGASDARAASILAPPSPIDMPAIELPADVVAPAAAVVVDVVLTIDALGAVTDVVVTHSAGEAIDNVVIAGAKRFRFRPATQDGVPIPVRIPFSQRFEPPPPPPPSPTADKPALDAVIQGIVVARGSRKPVVGADVIARDPLTGYQSVTVTDARGIFELPVRAEADLELRISAPEHEKFLQRERLEKNQHLKVKYLIDRKSYGQYESYVRAETERTEVSRTTLSGPEIHRIPGTFGDPFRVVNVLPGVTSVMGLLPLPIVRGSSPGNTGTLLDGVRLPLLFHLLGGPSVIHPEFIDHVDFYPGGFPVNYGGYTGGIIDGVTRAARPDEHRIDMDLNLTQSGGFVRQPVPQLGMTATIAGRIGYPGILLSLLAPDVSLSYWDYQARFDGGRAGHRWTVFFYGAKDELKTRQSSDMPLTTVLRFAFHRLDLRYERGDSSAGETYRLVFGYDDSLFGGSGNSTQATGDNGFGNGAYSVNPILRVHRSPTPWLQLRFGLESYAHSVSNPASTSTTTSTPLQTTVSNLFNRDGFYSASGAFVEGVLKPTERLRLIPGLRMDVYDERQKPTSVTKWGFDPRLLVRYHLSDVEHGSVWLKGVVGRYHQPPRLFIPIPGLDESSLNLGLLASTQYSVGAEAKLGAAAEIDVNAYYNDMDPVLFDLTVNPTSTDVQQPQPTQAPWEIPAANGGRQSRTLNGLFASRAGRSYGLELLLRRREADRLFGWISYTLSRSDRRADDGQWHPFDFDRLHVANVVAGLRLPRNWEFGTRFLFQTGTPLTTIYGTNVARSDGQFRLDLRIDKRAVWNKWLLDFYVDVINTTVAAESGGLLGGQTIRYIVPTIGFRAVL